MAPMSKLIAMSPKPPLKQLVCKLIGTLGTQTIPFRLDSDTKTLQHQIKKQFNSNVNTRDLKLFMAKKKNGESWLRARDADVVATSWFDSPSEVEKFLCSSQLIDEKNILSEVLGSAPDEYVIHVLAKECPVHPTRAARWEDIERILPPQEPTWLKTRQPLPPSKDDWHKLYEHTYEPQLQQYVEAVAPIKAKKVEYLVSWLGSELVEFLAKDDGSVYLRELLQPCLSEHPDLSLGWKGTIHGFRANYHASAPRQMSYRGNPIFIGEADCDDVKQSIARVLTCCEAAADSGDLREVFGAVVTKDGKWIFLRSLDDKILIDDDEDNRLVFDDNGQPSRASVERLCGKLHSMVMANLTPPEPGWREWWGEAEEEEDD